MNFTMIFKIRIPLATYKLEYAYSKSSKIVISWSDFDSADCMHHQHHQASTIQATASRTLLHGVYIPVILHHWTYTIHANVLVTMNFTNFILFATLAVHSMDLGCVLNYITVYAQHITAYQSLTVNVAISIIVISLTNLIISASS